MQCRDQASFNGRRLAWVLGAMCTLTACADLHVQSVSANPQAQAYALRGPSVDHVEAEAARLCRTGYEVQRQSWRQTRPAGELFPVRWWNAATAWVNDDDTQVQMVVACKAAATPPSP